MILMVKTMVSCKFSLKPIQWISLDGGTVYCLPYQAEWFQPSESDDRYVEAPKEFQQGGIMQKSGKHYPYYILCIYILVNNG